MNALSSPRPDHRACAAPVLVIGAGIGGLATALRLAAAGHAVTVLERHARPGGKMRALPSAAGPVDAGPTVLTMRRVFDDLCAEAGTRLDDHVRLIREPLLARHFWPDGMRLDLTDDASANEASIGAFAGPQEARAYRGFEARTKALFDAFEAPMMGAAEPSPLHLAALVARRPALLWSMDPARSLAGHLARHFADPRLRQLFGRYATYVGGAPGAVPALLGLVWQAEARGIWRVEGGMHRLARALAEIARARGVSFRFGVDVRAIEVTGGRACGVTLEDGSRLAARAVVFNGDPAALHAGLLGPGPRGAVAARGISPRSLSAHVWSFAARPSLPDLAHHNVFFGPDADAEFAAIARGEIPRAPTLYVCAQDRGTGSAAPRPDGLERFEIILNAAARPPKAQPEPQELARCLAATFPPLSRLGLNFSPQPGREALSTPDDFARLFPGSAGAIYGRSPAGLTAALARPRARTRVTGLYLAGGGAHPGAGVPMAALSGRHAAETMLADLASTSPSRPTATPGGTWTGSAPMAGAPSRSSAS